MNPWMTSSQGNDSGHDKSDRPQIPTISYLYNGGTMTNPQDIDEYIARFPEQVQLILEKVRNTIREAAPDAEETIAYQIPTFRLNGNLVHFAAYKKHIGFYPTPAAIEKFKKELSVYETSKGTVKFPLDQPVPYDLIREITEFRVQDNLSMGK
jgi:uncharacterized protein YdhG (YjbR/CyaY superfamily)